MTVAQAVASSTKKSGVPIKVRNRDVLEQIAGLV
jgi:hypothetical protein